MARTKIPIFLAAAVAGGLALGIPGAAAAQSVGFTVLPSDDGVYPPRPITVENVVDPGVRPVIQNNEQAEPQTVCEGNNCNNNGWIWPQQNWQGWNSAWSTEWNYGPGYDGVVYDAYGVAPDPERIAYYRLLWDLA